MTFLRLLVIAWQLFAQLTLYLGGRLFARGEKARQLAARRFTAFFRNLGATFIKMGQILSARPDLLPEHIITELTTLQDRVPPFPFEIARRTIEADLKKPLAELFAQLDAEPIAAASVAQVHVGFLISGEKVAVKVQRPNIAGTVERDLRIIGWLAALASWLPSLRSLHLRSMAREFGAAIRGQLDFRREVRNNQRFEKNFAELDYVSVPRVYPEMCGDRVITMEFVTGVKITQLPPELPIARAVLGKRFLDLYYHMAFGDLFLHADLHPGNILIDALGNFCLLDTGLVYEVPPHYLRKFLRVAIALPTQDGRLIGGAYLEGIEMTDAQREAALHDLEVLGRKYQGKSFSEFEVGGVFLDIMGTLRKNGIVFDAEWTGLILSDITFEGLAKMVDGDIDIMRIAAGLILKHALKQGVVNADDPVVVAAMQRAQAGAATAA